MMLRNYGHGDVEATVTISVPARQRKGTHGAASADPRRAALNEKRAQSRAKTTIRRTIMAGRLDHLLTLTYRENKQDERQTWYDFTKFIRALRDARNGRPWPYVAVQEFQKRGAVHFHVAVCGFQEVVLLRRLWHQVIGGKQSGNIDVQHFAGPTANLAKYLAKYVSKEFGNKSGKGCHRYKRARGIHIPGQIQLLPRAANLDEELSSRFKASGAEIKFQKDNLSVEGPKWRWACSW